MAVGVAISMPQGCLGSLGMTTEFENELGHSGCYNKVEWPGPHVCA